MPVILDKQQQNLPSYLTGHSTVGDYLKWARTLVAEGRVLVRIELSGTLLEGQAMAHARREPLNGRDLVLVTADRKELSLTMLGKLAALIEWLKPQHREVAGELERGNIQHGLDRLHGILSAWQQIQDAYGNLAKLTEISLKDLPVRDLTGEGVLSEFCRQLGEIEQALHARDFVLLSDILQYEMEGAIENWMALLEATLGVVEPAGV